LLIIFATKLYLHSGTYISYKFYAGYHQKGRLFRGEFLFVRIKRHACVRSVLSYQVMVQKDSSHTRYRWSYLAK